MQLLEGLTPHQEASMPPISEFSCINPACPDSGKRGHGNLRVPQSSGKHDSLRFLRCRTCGTRFSERANTAVSEAWLPLEKGVRILEHLAEGCGIRKTARLVGVTKDTVLRLQRKAGAHAKALHDELVQDLRIDEAQFDEKWSFVGKKRKPSHRGGESSRGERRSLGSCSLCQPGKAGGFYGSRKTDRREHQEVNGRFLFSGQRRSPSLFDDRR